MNRNNNYTKSQSNIGRHSSNSGFRNGISTKSKQFGSNEINEWVAENKNSNIYIKSQQDNKIIMVMNHNGEHIIEITCPDSYPDNKKGFKCIEMSKDNVTPINFINIANGQFVGKVLSIERVIKHLANAFTKYQLKNPVSQSVIFVPNANANDSWDEPSVVNLEPSMVNLEPSVVNLEPSMVNLESSMVNLESSMVNLEPSMVNLESSMVNLESSMVNLESTVSVVTDTNVESTESIDEPVETKTSDAQNVINNEDIELINKILQSENIDIQTELVTNPITTVSETENDMSNVIAMIDAIADNSDSNSDIELKSVIKNTIEQFDDRPVEEEIYKLDADVFVNTRKRPIVKTAIKKPSSGSKGRKNNSKTCKNTRRAISIYTDTNINADVDSSVNADVNDCGIQDKWNKVLAELQKSDKYTSSAASNETSVRLDKLKNISEFDIFDPEMTEVENAMINCTVVEFESTKSTDDLFENVLTSINITKPLVMYDKIETEIKENKYLIKQKPSNLPESDTNESTERDFSVHESDEADDSDSLDETETDSEPDEYVKPTKADLKDCVDSESDEESIKSSNCINSDSDSDSEDLICSKTSLKVCSDSESDDESDSDLKKPTPKKVAKAVVELDLDSDEESAPKKVAKVVKRAYKFVSESNSEEEPVPKPTTIVSKNMALNSVKSPYQKFVADILPKLRSEKPNLKSTEYMKQAAVAWKIHVSSNDTIISNVPENDHIKLNMSDNNEVSFDDVDDKVGIYLNLGKYVDSNSSMSFNFDKLYDNAKKLQDEMEFGNSTRVKKLFSSASAVLVVLNEFKKLYQVGLYNNYRAEPINDNIYHLKIRFDREFFDVNSVIYKDIVNSSAIVEIEIQIDSKLYPFYPPKVKLLRPRLMNNMNGRIATMECLLLSKWSPMFSIETIIMHFKNLMNRYAVIDKSSDKYDDLENELIDLSLLSEIPARINSVLTIDELSNMKDVQINQSTIKSAKNHWASGTGYGHSGLAEWNIKATEKMKEERNKQLSRCIKNITSKLAKNILNNTCTDSVQIMVNSCYIPYLISVFKGNSLLELLENKYHFGLILDSLRIMPKSFTVLLTIKDEISNKSLYDIFTEIDQDCRTYLKTIGESSNSDKNEFDLINNFVNYYRKIQANVKDFRKEEIKQRIKQRKIHKKTEKMQTLKEVYKIELRDESFVEVDDMNTGCFEKLIRMGGDKIDTPFRSSIAVKQIAKELISHSKSMPLEYGSSIFYRYYPTDLKFHEFIITGPEDTPYDSGCFLFRMYCSSSYPTKNPLVNIYTTGGGRVRFNPNLYDDGTVCLSLLGTWKAQTSESWIPEKSTMLQIMISIQSLVMIPDPYFNEPGYESKYGSEHGKLASSKYNNEVRLNCMKWAMIDMMKNPPHSFETAVNKHFKLKSQYIKDTCAVWVSEATPSTKDAYQKTYDELCAELDKLTKTSKSTKSKSTKSSVLKKSKQFYEI